jgi:hypothetical protein
MPGGKYGEAKDLKKIQQGALMAGARTPTPAPITPLTAPTQRPEEPFTTGMSFGEGPGPEILGLPEAPVSKPSDVFRKIVANDTTGEAEALYNFFLSRGL